MGLNVNLEKKTTLWLGLLVLVLSIIYVLTTLGKADWVTYIAIIFGIFLAVFLFIEGGVFEYFRRKEYRQIGFGDILVWATIVSATAIAMNSILLFQSIKDIAPQWLISISTGTGVTFGVLGGIFAIVYIFSGRFK